MTPRRVTRPMRPRAWLLLIAVLVAACGGTASSSPGPTIVPGPTPTPSGGATFDEGQLRLVVMDRLGERWYCDPDEYPIAHGSELERALARWDEVVAEGVVYRAVAARLGINTSGPITDAQKQSIYHLWKAAISIPMDPVGNGQYRFDYTAMPLAGTDLGTRTTGLIDATGAISIEQQAPTPQPPCPICLSRGTRIDTPTGPIAV
ncbi:MAG TPA: hypothetical protein VFI15_09565, partial [Candidatus Limnocylindrales bacterium]|nr:hypothetical protein [Candidatus Limnocylindrales bacterium]